MFRRCQQMSVLAIAFFLITPVSATAQQTGTLIVDNNTGTTVRIGCDYYIGALGLRMNSKLYWTIPPGKSTTLGTETGGDVVASDFHFYLITSNGESGGWNFITSVRKILKQGRDRMTVRKGEKYHGYFLTGCSATTRSGSRSVAPTCPARL